MEKLKQVYICHPPLNRKCNRRGCAMLGRGQCRLTCDEEYSKPIYASSLTEIWTLLRARAIRRKINREIDEGKR